MIKIIFYKIIIIYTFCFYIYTFYFLHTYFLFFIHIHFIYYIYTFYLLSKNRKTSLWIHEHILWIQRHISRIKKHFAEYMLYSRQTCRFTKYKLAKFIKLIKRFRFLQVWLKLSDIWRCLSSLKWELFEAFSKVEILMFFDKRALNASLFMFSLS
jgi:hypothetical protein